MISQFLGEALQRKEWDQDIFTGAIPFENPIKVSSFYLCNTSQGTSELQFIVLDSVLINSSFQSSMQIII